MLNTLVTLAQARLQNEKGAVAVEYGFLVVLIAIAMGVGAKALGLEISGFFDAIDL
jgi:pilus assembly protein Flp/PilA